jgi:hypothetical protein
MASPALAFLYLIISLASISCLVYYLTHLTDWELFGYNLSLIVLCGSIIYTTYMFYYEIKSEEQIGPEEGIRDTNFIIDIYAKFLFSFAFAVLLFYILTLFRTNFEEGRDYTVWLFSVDFYVNFILPIFLLIDTFLIVRNKSPLPVADMSIIALIIFAHCAYRAISFAIRYDTSKMILPTVSDYLVLFLMTVNGYVLYDYMIHKRNYPGEYMLFKV